jgi:hypothetical protein
VTEEEIHAGGLDMTIEEIAWEFAELFDELDTTHINEIVAKNVPLETLDFFLKYCEDFSKGEFVSKGIKGQLPNLMLVGYLMRTLEEKLDLTET